MQNSGPAEGRTFARARQNDDPTTSDCEAAEVALLLMRAGLDHASTLWFQLLELATREACDWSERSDGSGAPLGYRAAAVLGVRSLAAELLSAATELDEAARAAAEACLSVCAEAQACVGALPAQRRWGEGAVPQPPQRPGPLQGAAGCC